MSQSVLEIVESLLQGTVESLPVTDAALVLSDASAVAPHLLARAGRLTLPGWQAILAHEDPGLLRVPLPDSNPQGAPAWLCLYRRHPKPWSQEERFIAQLVAGSLARVIASQGQAVDWMQLIASQRILAVTEEELCRIVLDIHDGPVQKLFAALNLLDHLQHTIRPWLPPEAPAAGDLQRVTSLLESSLNEIRTFLGTFRPPEFGEMELLDVLEGLVIQHEGFTGATVHFQASENLPPVSVPVKIALYRILQEALSNAHRHSGVQEHFVRLWAHRRRIHLEIEDHGRGFVPPPLEGPQATEAAQHIGLRGMRDRVHLVGGALWLKSAPGQGTLIHVEAPSNG